ncbi:MAG: exodeoxyribonuclease VII small subunit [Alphaproteobacteria bacterium]
MAEQTFDEMLQELETLVRNLESGRIGLEEAMNTYKRGMQLKKQCDAKLADAKAQIDKLIIESEKIVGKEPLDIEKSE